MKKTRAIKNNTRVYDKVISLGADCLVAMRLQELGLRTASYPLDWIWFDDSSRSQFEVLADLIHHSFSDLINPDNFIVAYNRFVNDPTRFVMEHDHETLGGLISKYKRRIKRFISDVESSHRVLFIYIEKNNIPLLDDIKLKAASKLIAERFPNTTIDFLFVYDEERLREDEILERRLTPNITVVFMNNSEDFSPEDKWHRNKVGVRDVILQYALISRPKIKSKGLVSVLLPTYNADKYLKQCLNSILNQTYQDFEVLVIDDGSTDRTKDILKSYIDPRIRLVDGPRKGLAAALNYGLKISKGKYIARIDANDVCMPSRFEKQVNFLENYQDIDVVGGYQHHFGKYDSIHQPEVEPDRLKVNLLFICDLCHSTLMFRKKTFDQLKIQYPMNSLQEDFELWNSLLDKIKFANIPEVLGWYRVRENSITFQKKKQLVNYELDIIRSGLRKYLNINTCQFNDFLSFRSYSYPDLNWTVKTKIQKQALNLFDTIEKRNKKLYFVNETILHAQLCTLWCKFFGSEKYISRMLIDIAKRLILNR